MPIISYPLGCDFTWWGMEWFISEDTLLWEYSISWHRLTDTPALMSTRPIPIGVNVNANRTSALLFNWLLSAAQLPDIVQPFCSWSTSDPCTVHQSKCSVLSILLLFIPQMRSRKSSSVSITCCLMFCMRLTRLRTSALVIFPNHVMRKILLQRLLSNASHSSLPHSSSIHISSAYSGTLNKHMCRRFSLWHALQCLQIV